MEQVICALHQQFNSPLAILYHHTFITATQKKSLFSLASVEMVIKKKESIIKTNIKH